MPKIPQIVASGQAPVLQLPRPGPQSYGAHGFRALTDFGERLGELATRLEQHRDKQELVKIAGRYEIGVAGIKDQLVAEPDVIKHPQLFTQRTQELQQNLEKGIESGNVMAAFREHVGREFPKNLVDVQTNATKRMAQRELAGLKDLGDQLSTEAATAPQPRKRDEAIATYRGLLDDALEIGLINQLDHQREAQAFHEKTVEKNMDFLRRTDRPRLYEMDRQGAFAAADPITRLRILEAARVDEDQELARQHSSFKQAQDAVERHWAGLANQGLIPQSSLEAALKGQDPFIPADKAREYQRINESPVIGGAGSTAIRGLMQDYHSGPSTTANIIKTRKALNKLARDMGRPDPLLDKALNELQTDERTMRGINAAEVQAGIKFAEDEYKRQAPAVLPGKLGTLQKNKEAAELADIRNQIRKKRDPAKVVEEMLRKRHGEVQKIPDRNREILDLTK